MSKTLKVRLNASQDYNAVIRYIAGRPGCVESVCNQFVYVEPAPTEDIIDRTNRLESFVQSTFLASGENSRRVQFFSQKYYDENGAKIKHPWGLPLVLFAIAWAVIFCAVGGAQISNGNYFGAIFLPIGLALPGIGALTYVEMDPRKKGGEEYRWELAESA